jgi:predicted DNA-binding antitoxin AbrB/MazE fold protein
MLVDAIYDNGSVKLPDNLRLKHGRFKVRIEIPDEELVDTSDATENQAPFQAPLAGAVDIRDQIRAVLGADYQKLVENTSTVTNRDTWHQHLEEKHLGRR